MDTDIALSFCPILAEFICSAPGCNVVILRKNVFQHLRRKHKIPYSLAKEEAEKITGPFEGRAPELTGSRYFCRPIPGDGESPLPAISHLPVYDIIRCELCSTYCKGVPALRSHMRCAHVAHEELQTKLCNVHKQPVLKGQTLFSGPQRLYFPVITGSVESNEPTPIPSLPKSILFDECGEDVNTSDNLTMKERSANLCIQALRIADFIEARNLSLGDAYRLTNTEDRSSLSRVSKLLTVYVQYFCELNPLIPLSVIEGLKIRDSHGTASFSLRIRIASKERYSRVIARFVIATCNAATLQQSVIGQSNSLLSSAQDVLSLPNPSEGVKMKALRQVHSFCRHLLLESVCASKGQLLPLEALFKVVMAGYACGIRNKRVRAGDSEDASHTAAALQYFCHISALGEFFIKPIGFGQEGITGDQERLGYVRKLLSTESYTPASFLRTVLLKTKHISAGGAPTVEFLPCKRHAYCGSIDNIEVQMNSSSPGSLGHAVRKVASDVESTLRHIIMMDYNVPASFFDEVLSFRDRYNERTPGYYFGSESEALAKIRSWTDEFVKHLSKRSEPIMAQEEANETIEWRPTKHASHWFRVVDQLSSLLYILVHICGGGPPRVTEMIDAKLKNTAGSRRNLFVVNRCIAIIITYSKTSQQFEKPKKIARFLDRKTTELLLLFVIYIKPTQRFLLMKTNSDIAAVDDYLFSQSGRKFVERDMYKKFSAALSARGVAFNVSMYRQYRTGIAKAFLSEKQSPSEDLAFEQAGHTAMTAQMRYAGGSFAFEDLSSSKIEGFHAASRRWHELLGLNSINDPVDCNNQYANHRQSHVQKYFDRTKIMPNSRDTAEREARGRNQNDARAVKRSLNRVVPSENERSLAEICVSSKQSRTRTHISEPEEIEAPLPLAKKRKETVSSVVTNLFSTSRLLEESISASIKKVLRLRTNETVMFRSDAQRAAVFEAMMHTLLTGYGGSMLVVLPTGGGKSLCWLAPAMREQQISDTCSIRSAVTVVIVPLIALQQDVVRRCHNIGIRCYSWEERFKFEANVVVCSVEKVFTMEYSCFVQALFAQDRLARIVVDEVHLLLQWKNFRNFGLVGRRLRP